MQRTDEARGLLARPAGFIRVNCALLSRSYYTISTSVSMELLVKCMLMQAWHAPSSPLYHILRIRQPPAEFSARISAVHAETGMRRYNNRSAVIIPYPHGSVKVGALNGGAVSDLPCFLCGYELPEASFSKMVRSCPFRARSRRAGSFSGAQAKQGIPREAMRPAIWAS